MGKGIGVLTGAASGIGRELALKLAEEGYDLAICDVDVSGLENVVDEIREYQPERLVMGQICDVADRSQVEKFRTSMESDVRCHMGWRIQLLSSIPSIAAICRVSNHR